MSNEELVKKIQQGVNQADNMEQLYTQNKGFIYKIAQRYAFSQDDIDDLLQEAYFGLCEAVKRYEDTAGVLFMSYAPYWIRQAIARYQEENNGIVRMPGHMYRKIIQYKKAVSNYEMQTGRKPTDEELRRHLKISRRVLEDIKKAYHEFCNMGSLNELIPGNDGDMQLSDVIADPSIDIENSVVDRLIEESKRTELWGIVEDNVTPEQNIIITARCRDNMTFEATSQIIGKSTARVRVLQKEAIRKLARIRRQLEEKFEINYAMAYNGGLTRFRDRWSSIVEDIAIKNIDKAI